MQPIWKVEIIVSVPVPSFWNSLFMWEFVFHTFLKKWNRLDPAHHLIYYYPYKLLSIDGKNRVQINCVKSARIRIFSGLYFTAFGLDTAQTTIAYSKLTIETL